MEVPGSAGDAAGLAPEVVTEIETELASQSTRCPPHRTRKLPAVVAAPVTHSVGDVPVVNPGRGSRLDQGSYGLGVNPQLVSFCGRASGNGERPICFWP